MDVVDEKLLEGIPVKAASALTSGGFSRSIGRVFVWLAAPFKRASRHNYLRARTNFRARLPSFQTASSADRDSHPFLPCPFLLSQLRMQTIKCVVVGDGAVGKASDDGPAIAEYKSLAVS